MADEGGARPLARRERVRMPLFKRKHLAPGAERAAQFGRENRFAEDAAARRERDHVALAIDARDVGGPVLRMRTRRIRRWGRWWRRTLSRVSDVTRRWRLLHRAVAPDERRTLAQIGRREKLGYWDLT